MMFLSRATDSRTSVRLMLHVGVMIVAFVAVRSAMADEADTVTPSGRTIKAHVVALDQPYFFNRLGVAVPNAMQYALKQDVVPIDYDPSAGRPPGKLSAGQVRLRADKRPRPLVLRAAVGDILEITFTNLLSVKPPTGNASVTRWTSFHPMGLELAKKGGINNDGSWVGVNPGDAGSLVAPDETTVYRFFASAEGTFLASSSVEADMTPLPNQYGQLETGLFGVVNVQPRGAEFYRSQVTRDELNDATFYVDKVAGQHQVNLPLQPGVRQVAPNKTNMTITREKNRPDVWTLTTYFPETNTSKTADVMLVGDPAGRSVLYARGGQHLINYQSVFAKTSAYPSGQPRLDANRNALPVVSMLSPPPDPANDPEQNEFELVSSDLTAIITGPNHDRFPYTSVGPLFNENPASPDRRQPYREFTIVYHYNFQAVQAFPQLNTYANTGGDFFAINYGTAGIGAEIIANRLGLGPMGRPDAVDPKFEEFFLSSWTCGDPAMIVDRPANSPNQTLTNPAEGSKIEPAPDPLKKYDDAKATKAFYPDDPANVYHSYMRDHVKFRVLNASAAITHVHHQHAHQWLHSPNSDNGHYLDSQTIVAGSGYTMEMVYNGSGNRNQTVGDSIFHCHFYPHFAEGMWSLWRVHDVYEAGTRLDRDGRPVCDPGGWNRAYPDGEIATGTPVPAIVPMPSIAMAPIPARVRVIDDGRRVEVEAANQTAIDQAISSKSPGGPPEPVYRRNPGYPFFIPGYSGHRPPHPPLDFAWQEDKFDNPVLDKDGNKTYLDGGLPRHLVLDGEIVRNSFSRWDFTKDFVLLDEAEEKKGNYVAAAGNLKALELPQDGTAVEQVAMRAHARRSHPSALPNGDPGNFTLNGLPPIPGAPYAAPSVRDDGDSTSNTRRYKAANVQVDVVLNKSGWHYPQQRILTLWEDVAPTVGQLRPPQPFFFRANSDETIEYWHTNLVPNYYAMDDFQVRTPTDVLGQHIHLVKFDVTSSDGAANGFNYEDGTFSPQEVRERIAAINKIGGLYQFNPKTQFQGKKQKPLSVVPVAKAYPSAKNPKYGLFGKPPAFQNWDGAQTTIQRYDTDPLLNNEGIDRTVRSVFTHDHFSPSTHQQAGFYAAMLVEPQGSTWEIPVITDKGVDYVPGGTRSDGGPTSWEANILTVDTSQSYREFAFEFQDIQLAYLPKSTQILRTPSQLPTAQAMFTVTNQAAIKTNGLIPPNSPLRTELLSQGILLSEVAEVVIPPDLTPLPPMSPLPAGETYISEIFDPARHVTFLIDNKFNLYTPTMDPGWIDPSKTVNAPSANPTNPKPTLISFGTIGTYSVNYRSEPLPLRVAPPPATGAAQNPSANAENLAFAYASNVTRNIAELNSQPVGGSLLNPGYKLPAGYTGEQYKFAYPKYPISLDMQPGDPFTPLLRTYVNDRVQVRAIAGAHLNAHSFLIHGVKYLFEPSYKNSGWRNAQAISLSEHFEMDFTVAGPSSTQDPDYQFSDYLYAPTSTTQGLTGGGWGIMRAYSKVQGGVNNLKPLPNNSAAQIAKAPVINFEKCFKDAVRKKQPVQRYTILATTAAQILPEKSLFYNSRGQAFKNFPFQIALNQPASGAATVNDIINIQNPYAVMYVNVDDLDPRTNKLKSNLRVEPLILRANAGDWIQITLINGLNKDDATTPTPIAATTAFNTPIKAGNPFQRLATSSGTTPLNIVTPTDVGLHPQLIDYDITSGDGANVGFNPIQTVAATTVTGDYDVANLQAYAAGKIPAGSLTLPNSVNYWYAGDVSVDGKGNCATTPIEFGSINLTPADPLLQHRWGLIGALVVEPQGSTWESGPSDEVTEYRYEFTVKTTTVDGKTISYGEVTNIIPEVKLTRASSTILKGNEKFREFVLVMQTDAYQFNSNATSASNTSNTQGSALNYRVEPLSYRYDPDVTQGKTVTEDSFPNGTYARLANQLVQPKLTPQPRLETSDPQTPVFTVTAGTPVRFRWIYPRGAGGNGGGSSQVPLVHGHVFQEEPLVNNSTELGFNPLSQWMGGQLVVPGQSLNMLFPSAGGTFEVPGDYLYGTFLGETSAYTQAIWGILRVEPE